MIVLAYGSVTALLHGNPFLILNSHRAESGRVALHPPFGLHIYISLRRLRWSLT